MATPWLFWHGQVAEAEAYEAKYASVLDLIIADSGGDVCGTGMDVHRQGPCPAFSDSRVPFLFTSRMV